MDEKNGHRQEFYSDARGHAVTHIKRRLDRARAHWVEVIVTVMENFTADGRARRLLPHGATRT